MQRSGCIFSCSSGKCSRESFSPSLLLLVSSKTGGKMFVEPADQTNYTFTLIRFSLSGYQETEIYSLSVGQILLNKWQQGSCEEGHPAFCWRLFMSIPGCYEKLRMFSFLRNFKIQSVFMKYGGMIFPCKWQLKIKAAVNPDTLGLVSGGGFSLKQEMIHGFVQELRQQDDKGSEIFLNNIFTASSSCLHPLKLRQSPDSHLFN